MVDPCAVVWLAIEMIETAAELQAFDSGRVSSEHNHPGAWLQFTVHCAISYRTCTKCLLVSACYSPLSECLETGMFT
jgi:hypothetical protein